MPFQCSICDEPSTRICVRCTKDACENHLCEKCGKCSDCCECEVTLAAAPRAAAVVHTLPAEEPAENGTGAESEAALSQAAGDPPAQAETAPAPPPEPS